MKWRLHKNLISYFKGKCAWCLTTVHELRYIFFTFNLFHHLFLFWSIEHQSLSTICRQFWSPMQLKRNHVSVAHSHSLFIHCTIDFSAKKKKKNFLKVFFLTPTLPSQKKPILQFFYHQGEQWINSASVNNAIKRVTEYVFIHSYAESIHPYYYVYQ